MPLIVAKKTFLFYIKSINWVFFLFNKNGGFICMIHFNVPPLLEKKTTYIQLVINTESEDFENTEIIREKGKTPCNSERVYSQCSHVLLRKTCQASPILRHDGFCPEICHRKNSRE